MQMKSKITVKAKAQQVAWVYDPHTDEEGCFGRISGKTEKLSGIRLGYSQSVTVQSSSPDQIDEEGDDGLADQVKVRREVGPSEPAWVTWTIRIASYLAVLAGGFGLGRGDPFLGIWPQVAANEEKVVHGGGLLQARASAI